MHLGVLVVGALLLGGPVAHAQIVHEKPAEVKAANRRALREAQRTNAPYKDTHLGMTAGRLKRGQSTPRVAEPVRRGRVDYNSVPTPESKPAPFLGIRLKKKSKRVGTPVVGKK